MNYNHFRAKILKLRTKKHFKVRNSYGVKQGWRWYKKNKWFGKEPVTEKQFGVIIRRVNEYLVDELLKGHDIILPYQMGRIELRKRNPKIELEGGKIKTNLPIDWKRTLELWYEDEKAFQNKTLVRKEYKEVFRIIYSKKHANFTNKTFYNFTPHREVKKKLSNAIKDNKVDAFLKHAIH